MERRDCRSAEALDGAGTRDGDSGFAFCICAMYVSLARAQTGVSDLQGYGAAFAHQVVPSSEAG